MTTKPAPVAFQPAPRPQSRTTPEQTRELAEATRDLGFGRTTSTPAEASRKIVQKFKVMVRCGLNCPGQEGLEPPTDGFGDRYSTN